MIARFRYAMADLVSDGPREPSATTIDAEPYEVDRQPHQEDDDRGLGRVELTAPTSEASASATCCAKPTAQPLRLCRLGMSNIR